MIASPVLKLLFSRAVVFIGNETFQFYVPIITYLLTKNVAASGIVFGIEWGCRLLSMLFLAPLADSFSMRRIKMVGDIIRLVGAIIVLLILFTVEKFSSTTIIAILGIGSGLCAIGFEIGFIINEKNASVYASSRNEEAHLQIQSYLGMIDQIAIIMGPALSGLLLLFNTQLVVFIYIALNFIDYFTFRNDKHWNNSPIFNHSSNASKRSITLVLRDSLTSIKAVLSDPILLPLIFTALGINLIFSFISSSTGPYMMNHFGLHKSSVGFILATAGMLSILAAITIPRFLNKVSLQRFSFATLTLFLGIYILSIPINLLYILIIVVILAYITDTVITIVIRAIRSKRIPQAQYASYMGAILFLNFLPMPLGGVLSSFSISYYGFRTTGVLFGVLALSTTAIAYWLSYQNRRKKQDSKEMF